MMEGLTTTLMEKQLHIFQMDQHPFDSWQDFHAIFKEKFFPLSDKEEFLNILASKKILPGNT